MEILQSPEIFLSLLLLPILFIYSSLSLSSAAAYTLPEQYFINCGSASTVHGLRNFTGDLNSGKITLSSGDSTQIEDPSSSNGELYRSARIFRKPSSYELDVIENGTYVVRFHFFPLSAFGNISNARFGVEALGFRILSNFSINNSSDLNSFPLVEEFLLTIPVGKFNIRFVPTEKNNFAFVNAIEVFPAPPDFIPNSATAVSPVGEDHNYDRLLSSPLRVIHRINIGGSNIMPNNDTLLRYWVPDDDYLFNKMAAKKSDSYNGKLNYQSPGATEFDAPDSVYNTAKEMNIDSSSPLNIFNISWRFDVKTVTKHLVRAHFCDIVSKTTNELLKFDLFIYSNFGKEIYPYDVIQLTAAPFYQDFVVDSDNSAFMNISIGPRSDSDIRTAFLNGLEIMEIITELGSSQGESDSRHLFVIIGLSVGGLVLVLIFLTFLFVCLRMRKWKPVEAFDLPITPFYGGSSHSRTTNRTVNGSPLADLNLGLKIPFFEILYATKNFDTKLIIGKGGFGKVYKGKLRNGRIVAVKRSEEGHGQGLPEFQTEIMILSKIQHHHLVSLIGYCDERDEMILVYEFMEKGTLRDHLYILDEESGKLTKSRSELSWDLRLKICIGAAKGIHYLHTGSNGAIIHRDIKSTNILLDEDYVAKVADFGLSRTGLLDETHVSTDVKGSFGYLDPEYFRCLQLTQKSDVYSFGVVLLEVLCARPAVMGRLLPREEVNLAEWAMMWQRKGELEKVVDCLLVGRINPNSLRKFGETVEKCLQESGADRPNMVDVLWDLEYCLQLQHSAVMTREVYEDSATDVSLDFPMSVIQRLPSHGVHIDEDDAAVSESYSFSDISQVNANEAFSQLRIGEAR